MNKFTNNTLERELISRDSEFTSFFDSLHIDDRRFVREKIAHFPRKIQSIIINQYRNEATPFLANSQLRKLTEKLNSIIPLILLNNFDAGEVELRELADNMSEHCRNYENRQNRVYQISIVNGNVYRKKQATGSDRYSVNGLCSVNDPFRSPSEDDVYSWCASFVNGKGLKAPTVNTKQTLKGCIKRMQDKGWWLRRLRKLITKSREEVMIHLEQVSRRKGIYCSDLTAANRLIQKQQQLEMLKSLTMTNELGEHFSLHDLYEVNVSNPEIRRNELMTRIRGFEDMSKEFGNSGIFVTLTCPSKYHNAYSKSGQRNPKWQSLTPYDGQQYLCNTWAKIRAEFARKGIRIYGLRIAEPQHDGTPHWHMMLFVEKHNVEEFKSIIEHYALEEDGDEQGAKENRVDFKDIDPKKGSATGYIAKYVCKNIDGANLDKGVYGEDPIMAAQRVEAWASCWGIRQFQQIGGVSVTVWRELRRLKRAVTDESLVYEENSLTELYKAADSGDRATYTKLMGGVFCIRKAQAIRPYYQMEVNKATGLIKTSWFDGLITKKLKGILHKGKEIITRIHTWSSVNNCTTNQF
ncbi:replication endonuclease [Paraglaciecola sp.]|uniref:replication endonuclease n=1 Tax=Paraglaciecola sp. TaxID=1920173 RepID=UPI0032645C48